MKKTIIPLFLFIFLIVTAGCVFYIPDDGGGYRRAPESRNYRDSYRDYDVDFFYESLSPYGMWVNLSSYGYVWIPHNMPYRWHPYTYGRWAWTDHGWTWISNFDWGWAPFHYGRWGYHNHLGWYWVPGYVWGPAWVSWRWDNLYIGWAPLSPEVRFQPGRGVYPVSYNYPDYYWVFVEGRYFYNSDIYRYALPRERNITIINYTSLHNNIEFENNRIINRGVDINDVSRWARTRITKYELRNAGERGKTRIGIRDVEIFRPDIESNESARPRSVLDENEARVRITSPDPEQIERSSWRREEIQEREAELMERSHHRELAELERKREEARKEAQTESEKKRKEEEVSKEISTLKQRQEIEKSKLSERHKKEEAAKAEAENKKKKERKEIK